MLTTPQYEKKMKKIDHLKSVFRFSSPLSSLKYIASCFLVKKINLGTIYNKKIKYKKNKIEYTQPIVYKCDLPCVLGLYSTCICFNYTVYQKILAPVLFSLLSPSLSAGVFKTWRISISKIIFH